MYSLKGSARRAAGSSAKASVCARIMMPEMKMGQMQSRWMAWLTLLSWYDR